MIQNYLIIITGHFCYIKSYNYNQNKIYHKYYNNDDGKGHYYIIINDNDINIKLIESYNDGNIRKFDL